MITLPAPVFGSWAGGGVGCFGAVKETVAAQLVLLTARSLPFTVKCAAAVISYVPADVYWCVWPVAATVVSAALLSPQLMTTSLNTTPFSAVWVKFVMVTVRASFFVTRSSVQA